MIKIFIVSKKKKQFISPLYYVGTSKEEIYMYVSYMYNGLDIYQ